VRALPVELTGESNKGFLLRQQVFGRGIGRLLLERAMRSLMSAILLGMPWLDALQANT
jgi:hypothetical protein